jgi:hypothetical protein
LVEEARCNGIRIPIGFFTLGRECCIKTEFERVGDVYRGAWSGVRRVIGMVRKWEVGVLVDFHTVYGGANGDAHFGTGFGEAGLWGNWENIEKTMRALGWIDGGGNACRI